DFDECDAAAERLAEPNRNYEQHGAGKTGSAREFRGHQLFFTAEDSSGAGAFVGSHGDHARSAADGHQSDNGEAILVEWRRGWASSADSRLQGSAALSAGGARRRRCLEFSQCWGWRWRRWGCTALCPMEWLRARMSLGFAWRWGRGHATCSVLCWRQRP